MSSFRLNDIFIRFLHCCLAEGPVMSFNVSDHDTCVMLTWVLLSNAAYSMLLSILKYRTFLLYLFCASVKFARCSPEMAQPCSCSQ